MYKGKKAILALMLALAMVFTAACGSVKNKISEKVAEKAVEKAIEDATGSKIDISEGGSKIKTESGTFEAGNSLTWPQDKMGDLPKPNGKVTIVMDDSSTKGCSVGYSDMSLEDAKNYAEALKKLGYGGGMEMTDEDGVLLMGKTANGNVVNFTYSISSKEGLIAYTPGGAADTSQTSNPETSQNPPQDNASQSNIPESSVPEPPNTDQLPEETEEVDMADAAPWPGNFFEGTPELEGKIVNIGTEGDTSVDIQLEYVEKTDAQKFIESLKSSGYTVDKDESVGIDSVYFSAYNEQGDWIQIDWQEGKYVHISAEKVE